MERIESFLQPEPSSKICKSRTCLHQDSSDSCAIVINTTPQRYEVHFFLKLATLFYPPSQRKIHKKILCSHYPANIYLIIVNNRNTRKRCEMCFKLTIITLERRHWRRFDVFMVNFEHISHLFLVLLLLTLNK